jgi:hypothetical protein
MLLAPRDSPVAIELWLQIIEGVIGTVSQLLPNWGYTVNLPSTLTTAQLQQIIYDLAYVRPAGMPFNIASRTGGTYLDTVNYYGPAFPQAVLETSGGEVIVTSTSETEILPSPWDFGGRVTGSFLKDASGPETYLGTVNYYGPAVYTAPRVVSVPGVPIDVIMLLPWDFGGRVTGAYLASEKSSSGIDIPCATNNQQSLLPDLLLTDPTLNSAG